MKLHESLGNTAEVFIGGSYIGTGKLEGSMLVVERMKDGLAGLQPGKFDLVLLCKGEDFKWPEMFTVLPEGEKPPATK